MNESLKEALRVVAKSTEKFQNAVDADKLIEAAEKSIEKQKELREKAQGDIMHGTNTGYGAEVRQTVVFQDEMYSMINRDSRLLDFFPGNHGQIQTTDSVRVSVYGELDYFTRGTEMTGNPAFINRTANDTPKTDKVTINFQKLQKVISVSREELTRVPGGEANLYARIEALIRSSFAKTIESLIINGDSDATLTTNINGVGSGRLTDHRYGIDGLRKVGIANGVVGASSAYSRATLKLMYDILDYYSDDTDNLMWINSNAWGSKVRFDTTYSTQQVFNQATNTIPGYVLAPEGITAYQTKDMPKLVATSGKVDGSTPANNTQNCSLLVYRPCVQYAFGADMNIVVHVVSDGIMLDCTAYFGFVVANNLAGLGKTVALGLCVG